LVLNTVKPVLSGHPLLSGQQYKSHFNFSFPTFTVKNTFFQRTPLNADADTFNLTFMVISIVRNLHRTDTAKRMHEFFVHVLVDRSFNFANKLSCHRHATFCYSALFLQNFCSRLIL